MNNEKEKTAVGKFLQKVGGPVIRSAIKIGLPLFGTPIVELASNLLGAKKIDSITKLVIPKHSYLSIGLQLMIATAITASVLYAFFTKAITVQEAVEILKDLIPA